MIKGMIEVKKIILPRDVKVAFIINDEEIKERDIQWFFITLGFSTRYEIEDISKLKEINRSICEMNLTVKNGSQAFIIQNAG